MFGKGKIPEEIVEQLKQAHPKSKLFKWRSIDGKDEAAILPLTRAKLDFIRKLLEKEGRDAGVEEINQRIFDECVLWPNLTPEELDNAPMGLVPSVVKTIQEKSGYINVDIFGNVTGPDIYTTILKEGEYWGDLSDEEAEKLLAETKFYVVKVRIDRYIFAIRPMTRADVLIANQSTFDPQTAMLASVTLWPTNIDWDEVPAGVCEILGRKVSEISGWELEATCEEL